MEMVNSDQRPSHLLCWCHSDGATITPSKPCLRLLSNCQLESYIEKSIRSLDLSGDVLDQLQDVLANGI